MQDVGVHHIDLNFGCPVRKVTSRGGGSALPLRPRLFRRLVAAAVAAAGPGVALTVKLRMGLSPDLLTFLQVGVVLMLGIELASGAMSPMNTVVTCMHMLAKQPARLLTSMAHLTHVEKP